MPLATSTILLNKPYGVLSQFTPEPGSRWRCLADLVKQPGVYAAGRLDADSEGLLLLTSEGRLQQRLTDPRFGHWRTYWAQVEGEATDQQLQQLQSGLIIQGQQTLPGPEGSRMLKVASCHHGIHPFDTGPAFLPVGSNSLCVRGGIAR